LFGISFFRLGVGEVESVVGPALAATAEDEEDADEGCRSPPVGLFMVVEGLEDRRILRSIDCMVFLRISEAIVRICSLVVKPTM